MPNSIRWLLYFKVHNSFLRLNPRLQVSNHAKPSCMWRECHAKKCLFLQDQEEETRLRNYVNYYVWQIRNVSNANMPAPSCVIFGKTWLAQFRSSSIQNLLFLLLLSFVFYAIWLDTALNQNKSYSVFLGWAYLFTFCHLSTK